MYKCPDCGAVLVSGGGCWVCYECGQEGCIVTNLERVEPSYEKEGDQYENRD